MILACPADYRIKNDLPSFHDLAADNNSFYIKEIDNTGDRCTHVDPCTLKHERRKIIVLLGRSNNVRDPDLGFIHFI